MLKEISEKQKKTILIVILSIAFIYIDLALIFKLQISNLKNTSLKLRQVQSALRQYKQRSGRFKDLEDDFKTLISWNSAVENKIFYDSDLSLLLDTISQKANSQRIKIMQIRPSSIIGENEKGIDDTSDFDFHPLKIQLELSCGYHQLGEFLNRIEDNPLIAASELKIAPDAADIAKQKVNLTLNVYIKQK